MPRNSSARSPSRPWLAARQYQSVRSMRSPSSRSTTSRRRRRLRSVRGGGSAVTIRLGDVAGPRWRTAKSMGRPSITITRRYVEPSHRSIRLRGRRRNAHTVKSRRNGGIGRSTKLAESSGCFMIGTGASAASRSLRGKRCPAHSSVQVLLQGYRVVVLSVVRAVDQGDSAAPRCRHDRSPRFRSRIELIEVALTEGAPLARIVTEPLSQRRARSDFLQPRMSPELRLGNPTRPQSFDQESSAIGARSWIVDAFQCDHVLSPPFLAALDLAARAVLQGTDHDA